MVIKTSYDIFSQGAKCLKKNKVKGRKKQFKKERLKVSFTTELYCLLKTCCRLNWIWWIAGCNYKPKEVEDDRCGSRPKPAKIRDDEFQLSILKKRNNFKRSEGGRRPTERSVFNFFFFLNFNSFDLS